MTASRDPDRLIHQFVLEGEEQLDDQVFDAVRAEIEHKPQRAFVGPWRMPIMSKIVGFGLAAAAVVAVVLIGSQVIGSNPGGLGADPTPTATAEPTPTPYRLSPSRRARRCVPPRARSSSRTWVHPRRVIASPSRFRRPAGRRLPDFEASRRSRNGGPSQAAHVALGLAGRYGVRRATGIRASGQSTTPDTPVTTVDEIVAALAAQASRDASDPVDVTVGGYPERQSPCTFRTTRRSRTATTAPSSATARGHVESEPEPPGAGPDR